MPTPGNCEQAALRSVCVHRGAPSTRLARRASRGQRCALSRQCAERREPAAGNREDLLGAGVEATDPRRTGAARRMTHQRGEARPASVPEDDAVRARAARASSTMRCVRRVAQSARRRLRVGGESARPSTSRACAIASPRVAPGAHSVVVKCSAPDPRASASPAPPPLPTRNVGSPNAHPNRTHTRRKWRKGRSSIVPGCGLEGQTSSRCVLESTPQVTSRTVPFLH